MKKSIHNDSPCMKICQINSSNGFCEGCFRTIEEIASWSLLNDQQKQIVYLNIERRKKSPDRASQHPTRMD